MPKQTKTARHRLPHLPVSVPLPQKEHVHNFWTDFRTFAFQGNLIDLSVGVVIGTAFKQVTTSLVENVIMPPIGLLLGNADFSQLYISLTGETYGNLAVAEAANAPIIKYGQFLTDLIDFFLVALSIYIFLRFILRQQPAKKEEKK